MKKAIALLLLCAFVLLSLGGCGEKQVKDKWMSGEDTVESEAFISDEDQQKRNYEREFGPDDMLLGAELEGVFTREIEGEGEPYLDELLEIRIYGEMLLMEHSLVLRDSRELYDTWAEEFWADFPGVLNGNDKSISGKSQCYSFMAMGGDFQELPAAETLSLTEDGVSISYADGMSINYRKSEEQGIHTSPEKLREFMGDSVERLNIPQIIGSWSCQSGNMTVYLEFNEDGSFVYASKAAGQPSCVLKGCWGYNNENERLELLSERSGYGCMPQVNSLWWNADEAGNLYLQDFSEEALSPLGQESIFTPVDGNFSINPYNLVPFGYCIGLYLAEGSFTDEWAQEFSYSYKLPWVLGNTAEIEELNKIIADSYGAAADEALAQVNNSELPLILSMDWESSVYKNLLFISIWADEISDFREYSSFCLDLQQGSLISTPEILQQLGVSEAQFTEACNAAAEEFYIAQGENMPDCVRESSEYSQQFQWTVSPENINTELMVYVDSEGRLVSITPIGSLAGADWYYQLIYPELGRRFY